MQIFSYDATNLKKINMVKFCIHTCTIFAGPVTYYSHTFGIISKTIGTAHALKNNSLVNDHNGLAPIYIYTILASYVQKLHGIHSYNYYTAVSSYTVALMYMCILEDAYAFIEHKLSLQQGAAWP